MKYRVSIVQENRKQVVESRVGENLLDLLAREGYDIYSPCGGEGTCGKCVVRVKGMGIVLACRYAVEKDITVEIPGTREMKVLISQYEHTVDVEFNPEMPSPVLFKPVGCAIDIGTSTIVFHFVDLETGILIRTYSDINPQAVYGSDIISRIKYCMENNDGVKAMQSVLVDSINNSISRFTNDSEIKNDEIISVYITGNTTMLHFMAGVDPSPIAVAPYTPEFISEKKLDASSAGLHIYRKSSIVLLPSVSGFVGADIVSGLAAIDPGPAKKWLYLDIGTNGEIALVNGQNILACSTAAGPAFEGARISCGCPAVEGAISSYNEGIINTIAGADPVGVCGSGLVDIISFMLGQGLISPGGEIGDDFMIFHDNEHDLRITGKDVREVQLAKAAISAGMDILLKRAGCSYEDIEIMVLAGGFGNYLSVDNAVTIGLLPGELSSRVIQVGNAAGTGALLALKSVDFSSKLDKLASSIEYIELSTDREFAELFVERMGFG